MLVYALIALFY